MSIKERLEQDLKTALLNGQKDKVTVLRGLKSAILYVEVEKGKRDTGLSEDELMAVLAKESKKRQESADLYVQGGDPTRQATELAEKAIIDEYLPEQMSEDDLKKVIDKVVSDMGEVSPAQMGQVIGQVRQQVGGTADGGVIARLVKERLSQ